MIKKSTRSSSLSFEYDGFEGIDRSSGAGGLTDIVNFRIMNDRSLKKRPAFAQITSLVTTPRAHYVVDSDTILVLTGQVVYKLDLSSLDMTTVGFTDLSSGDAQFFCYEGSILLLDGDELYVIGDGNLSPLEGYVPLYGKDWDPLQTGTIHEQINLLSNRLRVSFLLSEAATRFMFNIPLQSIDAVFVNDERANSSLFTIDDGRFSVSGPAGLEADARVTFFVTFDALNNQRELVTGMTRAAIYGSAEDGRSDSASIAFYSNKGAKLLCTRRIDTENQSSLFGGYSDALPIYVTKADSITVGDGVSTINAVCRRGNRLLVFTSTDTYALFESDPSSRLTHVSSMGGCVSPNGAIPIDDTAITVSGNGILRWSPARYDSSEYVAEHLSTPLGNLLDGLYLTDAVAYFYRGMGELWFSIPGNSEKQIFVYNVSLNAWYRFIGINADSFFEINGRLGFFSGSSLCLFDPDRSDDFFDGETNAIVSSVTTGRVNFGSFDTKKRLFCVALRSDPGASVNLTVTDALGNSKSSAVTDFSGELMGYIEARTDVLRSRYYNIRITCASSSSDSIYGISLFAAK